MEQSQNNQNQNIEEYKKMLSELIQRQMAVLGPNIALDKAMRVTGLELNEDGSVKAISADPQMVLWAAAEQYKSLCGPILDNMLDMLFKKYPSLKKA